MSHIFCVADFDKKQKMFYFGLSKDPRTIYEFYLFSVFGTSVRLSSHSVG